MQLHYTRRTGRFQRDHALLVNIRRLMYPAYFPMADAKVQDKHFDAAFTVLWQRFDTRQDLAQALGKSMGFVQWHARRLNLR